VLVLRHLVTTTWSGKFKPTLAPDEYKLKIYVGGRGREETAQQKAIQQIAKFMPSQGYAYYTIVGSRYIWLPASAYEFTILFRRP
jgi:hypothetical protein